MESSPFQSHPKVLEITKDCIHAVPKVMLFLIGHARICRTLHGGHCMLHRFLMGGFELSVKGEIGDVHVRIASRFQAREPGDQMIPHRDRHVLKTKGCAQSLSMVSIAV